MQVQQLKSMGIEVMLSPYMHSLSNKSLNYAAAAGGGHLAVTPAGVPSCVGWQGACVYDLFQARLSRRIVHARAALPSMPQQHSGRSRLALQAKTRQFMFDHVRRGLVEPYGLSHWWLDCDEP